MLIYPVIYHLVTPPSSIGENEAPDRCMHHLAYAATLVGKEVAGDCDVWQSSAS